MSSVASNNQSSSRAPTFHWWLSPYYPANSGQQTLITPGPEQVSSSPQLPTSHKITPTPTAFQVTATGITKHRLTIVKTASLSVPNAVYSRDGACGRLCSFKEKLVRAEVEEPVPTQA
jgi:hypothetical protein